MTIRFRANDGQEYDIPDFTVLRELIRKGIITGTTMLFEGDSKTWIAATLHPATKSQFAARAPDENPAANTKEPVSASDMAAPKHSKKKLTVRVIRAIGVSLSALVLFELYSVQVNGKVTTDPIQGALPFATCLVLCLLLAVFTHIISRARVFDARRSFLLGYSLLYAIVLLCSFYLIPSPTIRSKRQAKGASITANKRGSSNAKPKPPATDLPSGAAASPEKLAAAQVEQAIRHRLQIEVNSFVLKLNQANLQELVLHPSSLGTSWGLEESRRRIAESKLAANEFESAVARIREELVTAISSRDIDPAFKRDYLEGINHGSWHGLPILQCQDLVVATRGFLTATETLADFMTKAAYSDETGQVLFHDQADKHIYDDYFSRAKDGFSQVKKDLAVLNDSGPTIAPARVELLGTSDAKPGDQAELQGGVDLQKPKGEAEAKSPAPKESIKPLLGPGQVLNLNCEQGKDTLLVLTDESDGNSEAFISSQDMIKAVLSAQVKGTNVGGDKTSAPIELWQPGIQYGSLTGEYVHFVGFSNRGFYGDTKFRQRCQVPCQSSGIGVLCIRGLVAVRVIE